MSDITLPSLSSMASVEPSQSYEQNKSVNSFDELSEHLSTKKYVLSPILEINSNWYTFASIESSLAISAPQSPGSSEPTPIYWSSVSIETNRSDKNSISVTSLSSSRSRTENTVSTGNPFITRIESSFGLTLLSAKVPEQTMSPPNQPIDRSESSRMTSRAQMLQTASPVTTSSSPVPHPLCPEGLPTKSPREALDKPFEDYLIRTGIANSF